MQLGHGEMWRDVTVHESNSHTDTHTCFSWLIKHTHTHQHTRATYKLSLNPSAVKVTHRYMSLSMFTLSNLHQVMQLYGSTDGGQITQKTTH